MEGSWRKVRRNGLMWEPAASARVSRPASGPARTHRVLGASCYQIKARLRVQNNLEHNYQMLGAVCRWAERSLPAGFGNLIIRRLPGATSGQAQPGAPTLVRFAGDNRELGACSAEVVVASPARLSRCKSACPALTVCQQQDEERRET